MASDWATGRSRPIACWQAASKTRREPHRPRLDRPMSAREDCVERTERSCGSGRAGADAPARQQARGFPVAVSDSVARRASTGASGLKRRIESPAVRASPTGIHPRPSTAGPPDRPRHTVLPVHAQRRRAFDHCDRLMPHPSVRVRPPLAASQARARSSGSRQTSAVPTPARSVPACSSTIVDQRRSTSPKRAPSVR